MKSQRRNPNASVEPHAMRPLLLVVAGTAMTSALLAEAARGADLLNAALLLGAALLAACAATLGALELAAHRTRGAARGRVAPFLGVTPPRKRPSFFGPATGFRNALLLSVALLFTATILSLLLDGLARQSGGSPWTGQRDPKDSRAVTDPRRASETVDASGAQTDARDGALLNPNYRGASEFGSLPSLLSTRPVLSVRPLAGAL